MNLSKTAGTELLETGQWLNAGEECPLQDGYRLGVGEYELRVRITANPESRLPGQDTDRSDGNDDWLVGIGGKPKPPPANRLLEAFIEGADLGAVKTLDEEHLADMMRNAGALLRAFLEETMRGLALRDESKAALDLSRTLVTNNLLKPGRQALDAGLVRQRLEYLLKGDCPGFENPVENVRLGFADLNSHRLATDAAWRAVIDALLDRFDPAWYEKAAEDTLVFQRKAKCWDAYVTAYPKIVREIRDRLLAEEFAAAYEQQIQKLRSS